MPVNKEVYKMSITITCSGHKYELKLYGEGEVSKIESGDGTKYS